MLKLTLGFRVIGLRVVMGFRVVIGLRVIRV